MLARDASLDVDLFSNPETLVRPIRAQIQITVIVRRSLQQQIQLCFAYFHEVRNGIHKIQHTNPEAGSY